MAQQQNHKQRINQRTILLLTVVTLVSFLLLLAVVNGVHHGTPWAPGPFGREYIENPFYDAI